MAAPSRKEINAFVQELKDLNFDLEIEDNFSSYLGISIETLSDNSCHMTQKGLIQKIIETTGLEDCNPNWTPSTQVALAKDPSGELYDNKEWSYSSVVGMLLYVSNNTRPDITFAVSQVARFTANPKKSHASAVKTIVRYLSRTADKGIYIKPDGGFDLSVHVDADFAGGYGRDDSMDPDSVKSRYGYVIRFGGVPLVWKSQLISEICLSTTHSEYVALVQAVRTLIPLRTTVMGALKFFKLPINEKPKLHCKLFEDNQSVYMLAVNQKISPTTKYFNVKYHWFWSFVYHPTQNPKG